MGVGLKLKLNFQKREPSLGIVFSLRIKLLRLTVVFHFDLGFLTFATEGFG